jgi:integrase
VLANSVGSLISVSEASQCLGVSESWIYHHLAELPVVRIGRMVRLEKASLLRQFQARVQPETRVNEKEGHMFTRNKMRYQSGRVYRKGKQAKWYGMFRQDQVDADGKVRRVQRNICLGTLQEFPTKHAARKELERRMGSEPVNAKLLFSEVVARWKIAVVPTLKTATAIYYQRMLSCHIVPWFGQCEVKSISRFDIESFLAQKAKIYCRATLRGMRVSLGRILTWAISNKWLDSNPCTGIQLPQAPSKVVRIILRPEQISALAAKLEEPYSTLVLFLAVTGLRISEAAGVQVFDFDGNVLALRRRWYQSDNGGELGELKTKKSARNLPLPEWLASRVKALASEGEGFCFRSKAGTPINHKNAMRRYVHPACKELGFRIGGWHDLRHTFTTWALKKYPTRVVSDLLGHASTKTTLDFYSHVFQGDFVEPLAEMARMLVPVAS